MIFAAIGHQDEWGKIADFVNKLREEQENPPLPVDKIQDVYAYFPPVKLFDVVMNSTTGHQVEGMYIESFISPDELDRAHLFQNISKVQQACNKAAQLNTGVAALGGFTSIVIEAKHKAGLPAQNGTAYTSGNSLTAAFIAQGVQKACDKFGRSLADSTMLIIGSTGDIGTACVDYFKGTVKELLLVARKAGPLEAQESELQQEGIACRATTEIESILSEPDIVICVASSELPAEYLALLPETAIICDAGYPKNLSLKAARPDQFIFAGGMGLVQAGYHFTPSHYHKMIYDFPLDHICHGCILESVALAMENRSEAYSAGKGNITKEAMLEILDMATKHGIVVAPFFNTNGLIKE